MRHYWTSFEYPDLPIAAFRKALGKNRPTTLEGGGKGGSSPSTPDPYLVSDAQYQMNKNTAAYNKALNLGDYSNPFGSQQSTISGYDLRTGAPIYQTNITTNPQLQSSLESLLGQTGKSGQTLQSASDTLGFLGNAYGDLNTGYSNLYNQLNPDSAKQFAQQGQNAAYNAQAQYLDPQFNQRQESLNAQLAAQGLAPGSQAYSNAMTNFNNERQQAYSNAANQAILTGNQIGAQNFQNQLAGIGTQANLLGQIGSNYGQIGGLANQQVGYSQLPYSNLQQIAQLIPGYSGPATSSVNPPDITSLFNNQYQGQLGAYNARQQSGNQFTSGLMGLGGTLGAAYLMSDSRTKRDVKRIGDWNGTPVYSYRYVFENKRRIGVLAQESPKDAVKAFCGVLMVDYRSL